MSNIYKYRLKCTTENKYVYVWSETTPNNICPNNSSHTISTTESPKIVDIKDDHIMIVKEENTPTNGFYQSICKKWTIPASSGPHNLDFDLFKFPINLLSTSFVTTNDHIGDKMDAVVAPNTVIGVIIANVAINDIFIYVSSTVLDYIYEGDYVELTDGTNTSNLGVVIDVLKSTNQIKVDIPSTNNFNASTPTYVKRTSYYCKDFYIGFPFKYTAGEDKIGGSYIPANILVRLVYYNNSATTKDFYCQLNYLR